MYHFATMEELKRTVYAKADLYHSEYLMTMKKPPKGAALGIGMNYIRFAIEEPHLFRFLFQSDYFSGKTLLELICLIVRYDLNGKRYFKEQTC